MEASEVKRLREKAELSVRKAADVLGVASSTYQRYESGYVAIPGEKARLLAAAAGEWTPDEASMQALGALWATLGRVLGDKPPQGLIAQLPGAPAATTAQLMALARRELERYAAAEERITDLLAELPGYPPMLTPELDGAFWIGYYHERKRARTTQPF